MNDKRKLHDDTRRVLVACPLCESESFESVRVVNGFSLVRCGECSMVYVNPRLSEGDLEKLYTTKKKPEEIVALYDRLATQSVLTGYDRKLQFLEKHTKKKGKLLDFACAAGYFTERASGRGWEAHGVDIGDWVRIAAERRKLSNIHVGELRELGFANGYFDVVYAAQVLEHLCDPRGMLRELKRILAQEGTLYVDVPNYKTLPIMLGKDDFYLNDPPQHINYFTPKTLTKLLVMEGFVVEEIGTADGLKWENLIGKPVISEIADAYRYGGTGGKAVENIERVRNSTRKSFPVRLVRDVCYRRLKIGMNLYALCRHAGA